MPNAESPNLNPTGLKEWGSNGPRMREVWAGWLDALRALIQARAEQNQEVTNRD